MMEPQPHTGTPVARRKSQRSTASDRNDLERFVEQIKSLLEHHQEHLLAKLTQTRLPSYLDAPTDLPPDPDNSGRQSYEPRFHDSEYDKEVSTPRSCPGGYDDDDDLDSRDPRKTGTFAPDMMAGALELRKKQPQDETGGTDLALKKFMELHPVRGRVRWFVRRKAFDNFFATIVCISVFLVGLEIETQAQHWPLDQTFLSVAQTLCFVMFVIEFIMRFIEAGWQFLFGKEWKWNIFDGICVLCMAFEFVFTSFSIDAHNMGPMIRTMRFFRVIRGIRIMRATRSSREFRKMSYALQYSAHTLFWVLWLIFMVMLLFAIVFTQAVTEELLKIEEAGGMATLSEETQDKMVRLHKRFGNLVASVYTLFSAISSGRDWMEYIDALRMLNPIFEMLFICFVSVTLFGVMNVVTGVFVESALQSVQHYKDLLISESMKAKQMYMDHLLEVFKEIDVDDSGYITMDELESFLVDPGLKQYLESMDIQPDDARILFRLLDKDDSGEVSIDEFCCGCLRLKGEAKSFDIHCIIYENQRLLHKWREYMEFCKRQWASNPAPTQSVPQTQQDMSSKERSSQPGASVSVHGHGSSVHSQPDELGPRGPPRSSSKVPTPLQM